MKIRTLLVDSSYLLKRSYHGASETYTDSFGHIGGLYQFITTTRMLITQYQINKVVLVWDGEDGGFQRYLLDNAYKANREDKSWGEKIVLSESELRREKKKKQSILKQRKRIQAYAEELFLRQIEVEEIEADDIIAKYCLDYNNKEEIFLFTNDRDFAQLLDLNLTIIFGNIDTPVTRKNYFHFFGYTYRNALVMKIIGGDPADGIKGVGGIKEGTLLKLFPELKVKKLTVREICIKADEMNRQRVAEKKKPLKSLETLLNNIGRLKINYKLTNLRDPYLNEQAIEELKQLDMPLSPEGRGHKNLLKMMREDEFLTVYNSDFVSYVKPFYTVIMNEKQVLEDYYKKNKNG